MAQPETCFEQFGIVDTRPASEQMVVGAGKGMSKRGKKGLVKIMHGLISRVGRRAAGCQGSTWSTTVSKATH